MTETLYNIKLLVVNIEGNIGAGKTTLLERFEHSLSSEDKCKIEINHEPVDESQNFWGNDMINPLLNFYKNQNENEYVFQNYVLDIYQCRMESLSLVQQPYKVILMDRGLDSCHLFTPLKKHQYTNLGLWRLTDKYQDISQNSSLENAILLMVSSICLSAHWSL